MVVVKTRPAFVDYSLLSFDRGWRPMKLLLLMQHHIYSIICIPLVSICVTCAELALADAALLCLFLGWC